MRTASLMWVLTMLLWAAMGSWCEVCAEGQARPVAASRIAKEVTPEAGGTLQFEVEVSSETDDAGPNPDCVYATSYPEVYFGECFDGRNIISGFRFQNVLIPRGALITGAHIEFTVDGPYDNPLSLAISGEATGNAQPFSDVSRPDNRPLTAAVISWVIPSIDHWEFHEKRQTPDLAAIVQEIVNQEDWSGGNALAIIIGNAGPADRLQRRVFAFERGGNTGEVARLIVSFIPPPICDIQMSQASYVNGDTVTASTARLANLGADPVPVELKIWLGWPSGPPISLVNAGADGSVSLPTGFDHDFGPVPLALVTPGIPRGSYELSCRMLDPVTGKLLAEDLNPFEIR